MSSPFINRIAREHGLYNLDSRGIPSVIDGLKVVQRTALWIMRHQSSWMKVNEVVGRMMGSGLYVHGDASAGDAVSRQAGPYLNNVPLIEGKGAFGTRVSPADSISQARYISVRKAAVADALLYEDIDICPHRPNYDGSTSMPAHFLPLIPILLLNGVSGIATGWATKILPRRLPDLIDATLAAIDGKPVKKLMPFWERYDVTVKEVGANKYEIFGKFERLDSSNILITELPPGMNRDTLIGVLEEIIQPEKPKEGYQSPIKDYTDDSSKGIRFKVRFARGLLSEYSDEQIVDLLKLRERLTESIVTIGWNLSGAMYTESAEKLVEDFVAWRLSWYVVRYEALLATEQANLIYWASIMACFDADLPKKIQSFASKRELKSHIGEIITLADIQVVEENLDKISELASHRWTEAGYQNAIDEITKTLSLIDTYEEILADPERRRDIYRSEVRALKKKI